MFQIESRAQMAMLPRMQPDNLYDLTIEVAIVRPGPIQGDMVHPYLRRRRGLDPVTYPTEALKAVLGRTLGVPLFQEQAMQVAIVAAGFTPAQADGLRRAMGTFKGDGTINLYEEKLVGGMIANGYDPDFAARTYRQLEGFGSYGFPESHAASFALIAYASSWLKCRHPDVFCCALLNAQPMGFYAPAQIVRDARAHGVEVRPIGVNASRWDCTLEPAGEGRLAVRLGLRLVRGLPNQDGARIATTREADLFRSVEDLWRRAGLSLKGLRSLAAADAFACLGLGRREALWAIRGLAPEPLPLFAAADRRETAPCPNSPSRRCASHPRGRGRRGGGLPGAGLSLGRHPLAFLRMGLSRDGVSTCAALRRLRDGARVTVAGLVLVRQKPGSAKGVMFITLEDETDTANLVVWPSLFARQRTLILQAGLMAARGRVQREGEVIHLVAEHLIDRSDLLGRVAGDSGEPLAVDGGRGDEARRGGADARGRGGAAVAGGEPGFSVRGTCRNLDRHTLHFRPALRANRPWLRSRSAISAGQGEAAATLLRAPRAYRPIHRAGGLRAFPPSRLVSPPRGDGSALAEADPPPLRAARPESSLEPHSAAGRDQAAEGSGPHEIPEARRRYASARGGRPD